MTSDVSISLLGVFVRSKASWQTIQNEAHGTAARRFGLIFSPQPSRGVRMSWPNPARQRSQYADRQSRARFHPACRSARSALRRLNARTFGFCVGIQKHLVRADRLIYETEAGAARLWPRSAQFCHESCLS